jgi:hypothetical protein
VHRTRDLLIAAGYRYPSAFQSYRVGVKTIFPDLLVLASHPSPPLPPPPIDRTEPRHIADPDSTDAAGAIEPALSPRGENPPPDENPSWGVLAPERFAAVHEPEAPVAREFRFPVAWDQFVRVRIDMIEDRSLPAPCEPPEWHPRAPTDQEIKETLPRFFPCSLDLHEHRRS